MVEIVGIPAGQLPNQLQFHLLAPSRKKLDRESTFVAVGPPEYNKLNIFNHTHSQQGDEKSDVDGDEAREEYLLEAEDAAEEEEVE